MYFCLYTVFVVKTGAVELLLFQLEKSDLLFKNI